MSPEKPLIHVGDLLPAVCLQSPTGAEVDLVSWRGRPLVVVCVRYYG